MCTDRFRGALVDPVDSLLQTEQEGGVSTEVVGFLRLELLHGKVEGKSRVFPDHRRIKQTTSCCTQRTRTNDMTRTLMTRTLTLT